MSVKCIVFKPRYEAFTVSLYVPDLTKFINNFITYNLKIGLGLLFPDTVHNGCRPVEVAWNDISG